MTQGANSVTHEVSNPFVGLRPFEENEAHLFFGRDGQSDELIRRLGRSRFIAVVGSSGSGKSSLVRAGLFAALRGGFMTSAGSSWRIALLRPGGAPLTHLAGALHRALSDPERPDYDALPQPLIEASLRRGSLGLIEAVRQARLAQEDNLVVVADQFEELFRFKSTLRSEPAGEEAAAFVKLLLEAHSQKEVPIYVVLTMRSDFLGDCAQFRNLPETLNDSEYLIPRMNRDERRQAIAGPIGVGDGQITPRLVQRLLNDVGEDPDELPILQHALMRTWQHWEQHRQDGSPIDLPDYEAVGTMTGALSIHADEAFNELATDRNKRIAERLFKYLTEKGPDNREVRHPAKLKDVCAATATGTAEMTEVIDKFRDRSFLMPVFGSSLHDDSIIDISHESLIRKWGRLKTWVDEESDSRAMYLRLADAASRHRDRKAGLWRNPDLKVALKWLVREQPNTAWAKRYDVAFDLVDSFLRQSKWRAIWVKTGLLSVLAALASLLAVSVIQSRKAERQAQHQKEMAMIALNAVNKLTYDLPERLQNIPGTLNVIKQLYEENIQSLDQIARIAGDDPATAGTQAANLLKMGDTWLLLGDVPRARDTFKRTMDLLQYLVTQQPDNVQWQRDLGISHGKTGDVLRIQGDLAGALKEYRAHLKISTRLAQQDPSNADWQRDLAISRGEIGDALSAQGDQLGALKEYRAHLEISTRLARQNPGNADWQRDLEISHGKIGDVLRIQGDLAGALKEYRAHLEISARLAQQDPSNVDWQRDLAISHVKIGDVLSAQGVLTGALKEYRTHLEISARLGQRDANNPQWQRDLAISHVKIGDALSALGDLGGALREYQAYSEISARLVSQDASNADWKRDLAISHGKIGEVLSAQNDQQGALKEYRAYLDISERLAQGDPSNAQWQRDLAISHGKIGDVLSAQGDQQAALKEYRAYLDISERLAQRDPSNAQRQRDLASSHGKIGDVLNAQGDKRGALQEYQYNLQISTRLAEQDPSNVQWQRDLAISHGKIGDLLSAQGNQQDVLKEYRNSLQISARLAEQDPSNIQWQRDLAVAHGKIANALSRAGQKTEAKQHERLAQGIWERLGRH